MFDAEFYPTPHKLIKELLKPFDHIPSDWTILEPHAGKGDICEFIKNKTDASIKVIERNFDLQQILMSKGYPILGNDFLKYKADCHFDLIVMNPPFSNGDAHLLHAWNTVGGGGRIACILNANTILNPHTTLRKDLVQLINSHGSFEIYENAFKDAERSTGVSVALIHLTKPDDEHDPFNFTFERVTDREDELDCEMPQSSSGMLAKVDHLGTIINKYHKTTSAFVNFIKAMEELKFYGMDIASEFTPTGRHLNTDVISVQQMAISAYMKAGSHKAKANAFRDHLNTSTWKHVLGMLDMEAVMTTSLLKKFRANVESTGHLPITKENIYAVLQSIITNTDEIMKQSVVDVFDLFTRYYEENRIPNQEGWKTNKSWKCTKKVILPHWVEVWWKDEIHIRHSRLSDYADIDKACCWLMGMNYKKIETIESALNKDIHGAKLKKCESEFFKIKYFKKGTVHLEFKSTKLLDMFNRVASEHKNWLGHE